MNFTVKQLRAFVAVADVGNFRGASQVLNLSAGAVSLLVRELESCVGFQVFERTTRRVLLTRQGIEFLPAARKLLGQMHSTELLAREVKTKSTATLRIAAPLVIASLILPYAISRFLLVNPTASIRPVDAGVEDLIPMIEEDHADLALGADRPTSDTVQRTKLCDTPWSLWCSKEHPLAAQEFVTWQELHLHAVIVSGKDFEPRLATALNTNSAIPKITPTYSVTNITTALGLVSTGLGVTVAPSYVEVFATVLGLIRKDLRDPAINRELSLFRPSTRGLSSTAIEFEQFILDHRESLLSFHQPINVVD